MSFYPTPDNPATNPPSRFERRLVRASEQAHILTEESLEKSWEQMVEDSEAGVSSLDHSIFLEDVCPALLFKALLTHPDKAIKEHFTAAKKAWWRYEDGLRFNRFREDLERDL